MTAGYRLVLRGGRADLTGVGWTAEAVEVAVGDDGRIAQLSHHVSARGQEEWDLQGRLILPGFVDVHLHLDRTGVRRPANGIRAVTAGGEDLEAAIKQTRELARMTTEEEFYRHAKSIALTCLAHGTIAIRAYATVGHEWGMRAVAALVRLREHLRARMRIQVSAFLSAGGGLSLAEGRTLLEMALDAGAEVVGGAPWLAPDPEAWTDMLLDLGTRRDTGVDLHVDETLDPQSLHIAYVAQRTRELGLGTRVVASHCCSLASLPPEAARPLIAAIAEAGLGVVTLPATNLYLQRSRADVPVPRGLTRVRDLIAAQVPVAYASDNVHDIFNPVGSGDLTEVGRWTFLTAQFPVEWLPRLVAMGTAVPAKLMGIEREYGLREGAYADLVIVDAPSPVDAFSGRSRERTVLFHGRHVAGPPPTPR